MANNTSLNINDGRHLGVMGVIEGFTIATETNVDPAIRPNAYEFTVDDLLKLVRELKRLLDPLRFERLERLIETHINDKKNPHKTTLDQLCTSVLLELYKVWQLEDVDNNTGTIDDFKKILFQDIKIADIDTTIAGTAIDQITSCKGVAVVMRIHDQSTASHSVMFDAVFPGRQVNDPPTYAIQSELELPRTTVAIGPAMSYINDRGNLATSVANTPVFDWSYGEPMLSVWGTRTNLLLHSSYLDSSPWEHNGITINTVTTENNPFTSNKVTRFTESTSANPIFHGFVQRNLTVVKDSVYTVSAFVKADGRNFFGMHVDDVTGGVYNGAKFDLITGGSYLHDRAKATHWVGTPVELNFGWWLVSYSFVAVTTGTAILSLYMSDLLDGDDNHEGNGTDAMFIYGAQFELGLGRSPYIPTTGIDVTRVGNSIVVPNIDKWFDPRKGTFVVECTVPGNLQQAFSHTVFSIGESSTRISELVSFPITHKRRALVNTYGNTNNTLIASWSGTISAYRRTSIIGHSYSGTNQKVAIFDTPTVITTMGANTLNSNSTKLYLGCDRTLQNQLNGYIKSFAYYAFETDEEQLRFLVHGE